MINLSRRKKEIRDISPEVANALQAAGYIICGSRRINGNGTQLFLTNGCIVTCYDTGRFIVQGKNQDEPRTALQKVMPDTKMTTMEKKLLKAFIEEQRTKENQQKEG